MFCAHLSEIFILRCSLLFQERQKRTQAANESVSVKSFCHIYVKFCRGMIIAASLYYYALQGYFFDSAIKYACRSAHFPKKSTLFFSERKHFCVLFVTKYVFCTAIIQPQHGKININRKFSHHSAEKKHFLRSAFMVGVNGLEPLTLCL